MSTKNKVSNKVLCALNQSKTCTGVDPIGGKGKRRAKRSARETNNCPMCDDPTCKLTFKDFN